jgi:hypothetical protein
LTTVQNHLRNLLDNPLAGKPHQQPAVSLAVSRTSHFGNWWLGNWWFRHLAASVTGGFAGGFDNWTLGDW